MPTILVVEDNPSNMKLVALLLRNAGHQVLQAADAEAGLALARREHPDLVLMDIHLPGMDGLSAARELKQDSVTGAIKVIAVTGMAMQGDEEKALSAGCDGYIAKPISHHTFLEKISEALKP